MMTYEYKIKKCDSGYDGSMEMILSEASIDHWELVDASSTLCSREEDDPIHTPCGTYVAIRETRLFVFIFKREQEIPDAESEDSRS